MNLKAYYRKVFDFRIGWDKFVLMVCDEDTKNDWDRFNCIKNSWLIKQEEVNKFIEESRLLAGLKEDIVEGFCDAFLRQNGNNSAAQQFLLFKMMTIFSNQKFIIHGLEDIIAATYAPVRHYEVFHIWDALYPVRNNHRLWSSDEYIIARVLRTGEEVILSVENSPIKYDMEKSCTRWLNKLESGEINLDDYRNNDLNRNTNRIRKMIALKKEYEEKAKIIAES